MGGDRGGDLSRIPEPRSQIGRQATSGQGDQLRIGPAGFQTLVGFGQVGRSRFRQHFAPFAGIGRLPREDFAQDGAQTEHVRALVDEVDIPARLLWRHVSGRSQDVPRPGHSLVVRGVLPIHGRVRVAFRNFRIGGLPIPDRLRSLRKVLGQSPVHDLDLAEGADHDVERFQVAVDHSLAVGVGDRLAHLLENLQELGLVLCGRRPFPQPLRQRFALNQLHGEERASIRERADFVDGNNAGMLQLAGDAGLLVKTACAVRVVRRITQHDFHGQVPLQRTVNGPEDRAHAATSDFFAQLKTGARGFGRTEGESGVDRLRRRIERRCKDLWLSDHRVWEPEMGYRPLAVFSGSFLAVWKIGRVLLSSGDFLPSGDVRLSRSLPRCSGVSCTMLVTALRLQATKSRSCVKNHLRT